MATRPARLGRFGNIKCTRVPNRLRPRLFNAKDVARCAQGALDNGATVGDICEQLRERDINCGGDERCEERRKRSVAVALELIQGNNQTLAVADAALQLLGIALRIGVIFTRVFPIPVTRPLTVPLQLANTQVGTVRAAVATRRAANDDLFRLVSNL